MNKVELVGRLTRDPEVRYGGANNSAVARFTLACDRQYKRKDDEQTADFINCIAFGKTAEFIEKYFRKGNRVGACGRIQVQTIHQIILHRSLNLHQKLDLWIFLMELMRNYHSVN